MKINQLIWAAALAAAPGCSTTAGSSDATAGSGDSATSGDGTDSGASTSAGTTGDTTGGASSGGSTTGSGGTGVLYDVGATATATGGTAGDSAGSTVCEHVDAIFAFDVSGSMSGEIAAMSDASLFASFRDTLLDAGNGLTDFQLAIMDDAPAFPYYHDNSGAPDNLSCNFFNGHNYMISQSPNFDSEFACIFNNAGAGYTHVGDYQGPGAATPLGPNLDYLQTGTEMPARSAGLSVSHPMATQVNDGFVRDDAVLFVLTISDEDDEIFVNGELVKDPPLQDVIDQMTEVHDQLVAAKGGDPKKVVFLGIGAGSDGCVGPYGDTIREAEHLKYLVSLFEADGQGLFLDLCTGNLEQGILDALEIVDQSCDDFVPEG